ncbi:hypothetical protein Vretimale_5022 [Volvox reticuliferus]|uniref:Uncharacterized protein n=1 Tax=Volvox reticuliferus TaxID=1737510 RepID=A0A8J4C8E3_9CHLO|nr:hypothetical protein Vretifemale_3996 [Volvox reticuliferus]GIM00088.1 hypothetical protein Vretimale_5022 [Volvox reticuliferus]
MGSQSPRAQSLPSFEKLFRQPSIHAALFEDKVFGHDDWNKHRSAAWRHRIEPTVFFRVAVGFAWQLGAVALVSGGVGVLHILLHGRDTFLSNSHLATPFSMITFALSLLLVFKTNSSYSRWWEGRIIWGQIVNFGRNYARQALMWFPTNRPDLRAAAVRWAAAAPRVLLAHLREDTEVIAEVRGILTAEEVDWLCGWSNGPLGAGTALGQLVVAAELPEQLEAEMQKQVELYTNCAGGCERIFKTPIPPAYARHTSRFLMLYVMTCPVLLWSSTGWLTPLVAVIIAFLLLGVENIGVQVEEPFHVLPLYDICRAIEANIKEMQTAFSGDGANGGRTRPNAADLAALALVVPNMAVNRRGDPAGRGAPKERRSSASAPVDTAPAPLAAVPPASTEIAVAATPPPPVVTDAMRGTTGTSATASTTGQASAVGRRSSVPSTEVT